MSRRAAFVFAMALVPFGVVAACSDPPAKPAPSSLGMVGGGPIVGGGGGGEGGTDSGVDAGDAEAGPCNDVPITGLMVDRIAIPNDPPTATGGMITDGTYDLTDFSVFVGSAGVGGPTGITARASIRIAAGKLSEVIELGGTGKTMTTTRTSSAFSATGAIVALSTFCPAGGGKQLQFTANGVTLILTDVTTKEAFTFTMH